MILGSAKYAPTAQKRRSNPEGPQRNSESTSLAITKDLPNKKER